MYAETKNLIEKAMTNQEQIDKYLAGQMTEEEKLQFERLLSAEDSSLRDEMELQKEIILAIRRRSLKEMLQDEEDSIQKEKEDHHKRVVRWTLGSVSITAIAAIFVGVFMITSITRSMLGESNTWAQSLQTSQNTRGGKTESINEQLELVYDAIAQNDWQGAYCLNENVRKETMQLREDENLLAQEGLSKEEVQEIIDATDWIEAQYEMHEGHIRSAKKLLQRIANSDSYYSAKAKELLEKIF